MNSDPLAGLPPAPQWALNLAQNGALAVKASIFFYIVALLGFIFARNSKALGRISVVSFFLGGFGLFAAFGVLITLFVKNQFEFEYVFARADVHTTLQYKVAGVWAGQQGSFLLWGITSAIFGMASILGAGPYRRAYGAVYATFLACIAGILAFETPFNVLKEAVSNGVVKMPPTGNGLVPSLQNYWMVIHPPTIFLGFGALTIMFAYSVAALITGDLSGWVSRARPWALATLGILGLGICMGGFWAYETLGWGGFWMWDPVENASFVPWLLLAAFVHGAMVQVSRSRWHGTNLWLGALPFAAFTYGTFLTRSGVLGDTSVHTFAEMDRAALKILQGIMAVVFFGFGALYLWRGRKPAKALDKPDTSEHPIRREGLFGAGSMLLGMFGLVLAVGMSWPMLTTLLHNGQAKVEEPLYHKIVGWFFIPLMLLMATGPFVTWRGMGWRTVWARMANILSVSVGAVGITLFALKGPSWGLSGVASETVSMPLGFRMSTIWWVAILLVLCYFAAIANLWRLVESMRRSRSSAGAFISHFGLAVLMAGLIGSRGFERKQQVFVRSDQPGRALGYTMQFKRLTGSNLYDRNSKALFAVTTPEGQTFEAQPGVFYTQNQNGEDQGFTWPHIQRGWDHDVYMAVQSPLVFVWGNEGHWFKVGEEETVQGITVKYEKMTLEGTPGTQGARFGAKLKITLEDGATYDVTPHITVGDGPDMPVVGREFRVAMLGMNAADKSVQLQMMFSSPVYPITLFTKPLTGLVWIGTGILFFGGLIAAWSRRRPRPLEAEEEVPEITPSPDFTPKSHDAPVPAT